MEKKNTTSGLTRPSEVGPIDENADRSSLLQEEEEEEEEEEEGEEEEEEGEEEEEEERGGEGRSRTLPTDNALVESPGVVMP